MNGVANPVQHVSEHVGCTDERKSNILNVYYNVKKRLIGADLKIAVGK